MASCFLELRPIPCLIYLPVSLRNVEVSFWEPLSSQPIAGCSGEPSIYKKKLCGLRHVSKIGSQRRLPQ